MRYRVAISLALSIAGAAISTQACSSGFAEQSTLNRIAVKLKDPSLAGSRTSRKPVSIDKPETFSVSIEMLKADGKRDTSFDKYVRINIKPGTVVSVAGSGVNGRNVLLRKGFADNIDVSVVGAFGDARIVAEDLGYQPKNVGDGKPAQCLMRRNRSSSAAATIRPSRTRQAALSP